ncbi:MAG: polysaccharide biosynthesis/export family protein [bacterium]
MSSANNHGWLRFGLVFVVLCQSLVLLPNKSLNAELQRRLLTFRKGDAIRLTVWQPWVNRDYRDGRSQYLNLDGDYLIDSRGYVFLPIIGEIKVIGHNSRSLAEVLTEKFGQYIQDPIIIVEPLIRVTMLGEFRRPGTYLIAPDASLWELVDLAGGPNEDSNLKKMWVERGGRKVKRNLLSSFERAYSIEEIGIMSGDQVTVPPKRRFQFRDAFDILRFTISIINLYFLVDRL